MPNEESEYSMNDYFIPLGGADEIGASSYFLSVDDDNDVRIVLFGLVRDVAEEKQAEMLKAINECNNKFRYIKFILD